MRDIGKSDVKWKDGKDVEGIETKYVGCYKERQELSNV